jgi:hypothetical protein
VWLLRSPGWDIIQQLKTANDVTSGLLLGPYGMGVDAFVQGFQSFYNQYGGFALCAGYSTNTKNLSIYLLTTRNHGKGGVLAHAWMNKMVASIQSMAPAGVWVFAGSRIQDSYKLRRSGVGVCSTPLLFMYFVGTNNVEFD